MLAWQWGKEQNEFDSCGVFLVKTALLCPTAAAATKSRLGFRKPVQGNFPSTFPTSSKCWARQRCCRSYSPQFDLSKLNGETLGSQWLRRRGNWALTFVFLWAPYTVFYFNLIFVPLVLFPPFPPSSLCSPVKIEQKNTAGSSLEVQKVFQDARALRCSGSRVAGGL